MGHISRDRNLAWQSVVGLSNASIPLMQRKAYQGRVIVVRGISQLIRALINVTSVVIAMSGGVDSSVAAKLLAEQVSARVAVELKPQLA